MRWMLALALVCATPLMANAPSVSLRPEPRVSATAERGTSVVQVVAVQAPSAQAVQRSIRPTPRGVFWATERRAATQTSTTAPPPTETQPRAQMPSGFARWAQDFRRRALAQGISASTFDAAFVEVAYLPRVIELDRNQSEFNKQLWEYLDSAVSTSRVNNGREAFSANRSTLTAIERRYGVEAEVVAAIWGLESAYGVMRGGTHVLSAMATLAYDGRRKSFFEGELVAALRILQSGDTTPARMQGSWAGAMGHTQFMPTSFLQYAVDWTGDGRRDIWGDTPADALASTANYLRQKGWTTGQPWGMEVRLPANFDFSQTGERIKRNAAHWNGQGVRQINGQPIPENGPSSILVPAGRQGAAFVIFNNFHVIERYNPADAYVIGVGHLADRIAGGPALRANWPRGDRALSRAERQELQRRLQAAGCSPGKSDGIVGPNTIEAVRCYQRKIGQIPDGYANIGLLGRLRG